jgi:hypothetical protein
MKQNILMLLLGLTAVTHAHAAPLWKCTFIWPNGTTETHNYSDVGKDLLDKNQNIGMADKAGNMKHWKDDVHLPVSYRSEFNIVAFRPWPVLSPKANSSFAGATVLVIDKRTGNATLAQVVASEKPGVTAGGKCKISE